MRGRIAMRTVAKVVWCVLVALASTSATAQDLELDFHFLKLGFTRKAVIEMLGEPASQTKSTTLFVEYRRLVWIGPDGEQYVTSFVQNRLWRWKKCSASIKKC